MPIHDWTRVDAGIFHALHHGWISELAHALNRGLLPGEYYALLEQHAVGIGSDVITSQASNDDLEFYRRKQSIIGLHRVSDDEVVSIIEIVSSGNKKARKALRVFVEKAAQFLDQGIHLLIIDLYPPGRLDPNGIHGEIWQEVSGQEYAAASEKLLTLAAYETGISLRAYVEHVAVGDVLPDMPLFLEEQRTVNVPLEATYNAAFAELPHRWRSVLEK